MRSKLTKTITKKSQNNTYKSILRPRNGPGIIRQHINLLHIPKINDIPRHPQKQLYPIGPLPLLIHLILFLNPPTEIDPISHKRPILLDIAPPNTTCVGLGLELPSEVFAVCGHVQEVDVFVDALDGDGECELGHTLVELLVGAAVEEIPDVVEFVGE
jgi:hypothetical protein